MFQQTWSIEIVIARAIGDLTTNSGARKRTIVCVLPTHLEWREVPVVTSGHAGAVGVCFLVTARAIQPRHTFAFRPTHDVRNVTVPIVSLLWVVSGRVTVDAARRNQY
jgi:hypothetical protein